MALYAILNIETCLTVQFEIIVAGVTSTVIDDQSREERVTTGWYEVDGCIVGRYV